MGYLNLFYSNIGSHLLGISLTDYHIHGDCSSLLPLSIQLFSWLKTESCGSYCELWPIKSDPACQISRPKVTLFEVIVHTQTHNWRSALPEPLKWSVKYPTATTLCPALAHLPMPRWLLLFQLADIPAHNLINSNPWYPKLTLKPRFFCHKWCFLVYLYAK